MRTFRCDYFDPPVVELTEERRSHITRRHPDLLPEYESELKETLAKPDGVEPNPYNRDKVVVWRWFPGIRGGKFVVAHVLSEPGEIDRHWIVTAYLDSERPS